MNRQFIVRPYVPADLHAVWALENRVDPYEPEDEEEVREMRARALDAPRRRVG